MSAQVDPGPGLPPGLRPTPDEEGPPAEAARLDAFISYTRRPDDTAFVDRLRDELLARGKQVWLDRHQEWMTSGQDSSFLLRGKDLRQAESWYDQKGSHKQQPTDLQYLYIAAGRRAASRRQRALTSGVALALVVALVLAVLAFVQRNAAVANQHVAESRQLAAEGTANLASDPDLSALFSLKALQVHYTSRAENSLRAAAPDLQLLRTFYAGSLVGAAAYSANGQEAVTADENGTAPPWVTRKG